MPRRPQRYGWIPDLPDHRDFLYAAPAPTLRALPTSVDLRGPLFQTVYDQRETNSCTGNAIAGAISFDRRKQKLLPDFVPSRLFIYYNERDMAGTVDQDPGASIRDGIKSVASLGVCPSGPPPSNWPFDLDKLTVKPPPECYQAALQHKVRSYYRLPQTLNQMKGCLASGYPFVFGFAVYDSFESDEVTETGHAPMPGPTEKMLGGHAVLAVGYDDSNQWFIVRNSYGEKWGMEGHFTLSYNYLTQKDLSADFWTIRTVE